MAKVGLDAICAKLSRNAEMSSREVQESSCSPQHDDHDVDAVADEQVTGVDEVDHEQQQAVSSTSVTSSSVVSAPADVVGRENVITMMTGSELATSRAVDRTTSLMDNSYDDESALDVDAAKDDASTLGRRSRRKNFFPRCVQDAVRRASDAAAAASTTKWPADVKSVEDDDQTVLDLRTARSVTRQTAELPAAAVSKGGQEDQILDLSVSRCGRGESRPTRSSSAGSNGNEAATNMRVYAVNTMSELLHIYGLPDDQQTDLRKLWVPQPESGSGTAAQSLTACGVGQKQSDVVGTTDRTGVTVASLPQNVVQHRQQRAPALANHLKGL